MLLFPNALCCSLYERICVCAVTKIFTKFLPANNFCQLLQVMRKCSCSSASNAQAQLHFRDDQQRAFGISNISNSLLINHHNQIASFKCAAYLISTYVVIFTIIFTIIITLAAPQYPWVGEVFDHKT